MQATGGMVGKTFGEAAGDRGRTVVTIVYFSFGGGLVLQGMLIGLVSPPGVLVGVGGGLVTLTGLVRGSPRRARCTTPIGDPAPRSGL